MEFSLMQILIKTPLIPNSCGVGARLVVWIEVTEDFESQFRYQGIIIRPAPLFLTPPCLCF